MYNMRLLFFENILNQNMLKINIIGKISYNWIKLVWIEGIIIIILCKLII